ncbi:FAS1-like dehydratase domain-containing protein [Mycobacterium sp.]|uniref:FAS1-like dehydratase domain-containing protein n=1 Tax=Mycobacterium sp. TaxID=1785 RepID=UPI003D0C02FF
MTSTDSRPISTVLTPLTLTDLVRYAGASGDFNPIHHDIEFARANGHPGVFAMGMLGAGMLGDAVLSHCGASAVADWKVKFHAPIWVGDELTCRLTAQESVGKEERYHLEVLVADQVRISGSVRTAQDKPELDEIGRSADIISEIAERELTDVEFVVERGKVSELARALRSSNPLHFDSDVAQNAGFPDCVAPLTIGVVSAHWDTGDATALPAALGLDVSRVVHGTQSWSYRRIPHVGDVLQGRRRVVSARHKPTRSSSQPMTVVEIETEYRDIAGLPVVREVIGIIELPA